MKFYFSFSKMPITEEFLRNNGVKTDRTISTIIKFVECMEDCGHTLDINQTFEYSSTCDFVDLIFDDVPQYLVKIFSFEWAELITIHKFNDNDEDEVARGRIEDYHTYDFSKLVNVVE